MALRLYLKALTHGLFTGPGQDPDLRRRLEQEINENGLAAVLSAFSRDRCQRLVVDPSERPPAYHLRALEVYRITGKPISAWQKSMRFRRALRSVEDRFAARARRGFRFDQSAQRANAEAGLLDEVRGLISRGYSLELKQLRSVGYRQIGEVLQGAKTVVEAPEEMKQETRRLAKRQLTWYRADTDVHWYHQKNNR